MRATRGPGGGTGAAVGRQGFVVSVPSSWQATLSDEAREAFIIKIVNLGAERESLFLGGFMIFVWSAPHGLVVVGIHDNHNPPTIVLITSDTDLDGVLLHVSGSSRLITGADGTDCPFSGAATIAVMLDLVQPAGTGRWDGRGGREAGLEGQHAGLLPAASNHGKGPGSLGFVTRM